MHTRRYCNDYDVEIVDLDPNTGDVLCVAVVLVMATVLTKRISQYQTYSISSLQRHQYQVSFKSWCHFVNKPSRFIFYFFFFAIERGVFINAAYIII